LNCGDVELDDVTLEVVTASRGKAKAILLSAAQDAGFGVDWLTPVSIRQVERNTVAPEGIQGWLR
jgi:hypothetical protein